jgi:anti-sigma B factor antagonist
MTTVEKKRDGDKLYISIDGTLDANNAPVLSKALEGELADTNELYFDLAKMDYTSSVGLRVLLKAYQEIDEKDGRMVLRNMNDDVKEIFTLTGFTEFIEIED